ncbi:hypothetical protein ACP4OV_023097 [Aristida adscensionis]
MASSRAYWSKQNTKIFLDLCIEEKQMKNWAKNTISREGWRNIYRKFPAMSGQNYTRKQMRNKLSDLKVSYSKWLGLQSQSGLGCQPTTGDVVAEDSFWQELEGGTRSQHDSIGEQLPLGQEPPNYQQETRGKPPPFLEELEQLFGHTPRDRGTLLSAGGIRDSTPVDESEHTPPQAQPTASNTDRHGKRACRDESVDSPRKKISTSIEDCIRDISEIGVQRFQGREARASRQQQEVDAVARVLREDGVDDSSELHMRTMYLCSNWFRRQWEGKD